MRYCIDTFFYTKKGFIISGWALPEYRGDQTRIVLLNEEHDLIEVPVRREKRSDVLTVFCGSDGPEVYGFFIDTEGVKLPSTGILKVSSENHPFDELEIHLHFSNRIKEYENEHSFNNRFRNYLKAQNKKAFLFEEKYAFLYGEDKKYAAFYEMNKIKAGTLKKQRKTFFEIRPLFSILVPVYKPVLKQLKEMIESVKAQSYTNFELILANGSREKLELNALLRKAAKKDRRIRVIELEKNNGISENTNAALDNAKGDYVAFLDQDDLLFKDALFEVAKKLNECPNAEIIYTDEDKLEDETGFHINPYFKTDYNPVLLLGNNYICHFVSVKTSLAKKVRFRKECDGAQDHDFLLRAIKESEVTPVHIPKVLYSWRIHALSSASGVKNAKNYAIDAGIKASRDALYAEGFDSYVTPISEYAGCLKTEILLKEKPLVSIIIPNKDHVSDLDTCIKSIIEKTTYGNFEIIIIENNSELKETFEYYKELTGKYPFVSVYDYTKETNNKGFNYSALNNFGFKKATGEYILLLNNDTEVITPNFMERMVSYLQYKNTGIVGAKLYYKDNTVQHAGIVVLTEGAAHHVYSNASKDMPGYMGRLLLSQNVSAVTGACMMIKRSVYEKLSGLSEEFAVAYNDVDFCLRAVENGYYVVYDAYSELYHYESKSRGYEDTDEKKERFKRETDLLYERHPEFVNHDPYYNPNFSLKRGYYMLP